MFVHQSQLEHLLTPADYTAEPRFRREIERLFQPAWHFVGTRADVPQSGDFLSGEILGTPLLVRNFDGEPHAFLNVCAHRHCLLTSDSRGHSPTLRCQYHGWEYDQYGHTGKIPEARCFRPFDREHARLAKFRLETCGELIFVSLQSDGPSLREFLGPNFEELQAAFAFPWRQVWSWEHDYPTNWKVPIENGLESYHIPCIHPKTFGTYPAEELVTHELEPTRTAFRCGIERTWLVWLQSRFAKRLGLVPQERYTHLHIHPHLLFTMSDLFRMTQVIMPVSPTLTRTWARLYALRGGRQSLYHRLAARIVARVGRDITRAILLEDAGILEAVQRGLESSAHRGVIGMREERVYVFQKYVREQCGEQIGTEPAPSPNSHATGLAEQERAFAESANAQEGY